MKKPPVGSVRYCVVYVPPETVFRTDDIADEIAAATRVRRFCDEAEARRFASTVADYFDQPGLYRAIYVDSDEWGELPDGPRWETQEELEFERQGEKDNDE